MSYKRISIDDSWVKGNTYQMVFTLDHIKFLGITIPDSLLPEAMQDYLLKKQLEQTLAALATDQKLQITNYTLQNREVTLTVFALENPFPIAYIVAGIVGAAIVYGLYLTISEVRMLVSPITDIVGSTPDWFKKAVVPLSITAGLLLYFRGRFQ